MSDSIEDLVKKYKESVFYGRHPRSIGLFTIPEYPEYEVKRGMWSAALDAILTTLRYLAPATLLTLFWGQQSFFFRILKHIDSAFRAIVFSSEEQKKAVLEWITEAGSVKVDSLDTVWQHGWIVCGVLDAALPGACAGHPPTRLSMKHAQAIADNYLGVEPVFSRQELESNDALSKHQEWKLATYLDRIRQALGKITPPVSRPTSHRTSPETTQFTLDYVAKGSGLIAAQINNKMYFKIYPTAQQAVEPGEITILIRGPKDTYGMTVLPPILGKAQLIRQKLLGLQSKQYYTENALPITQGAAYLRNFGKNDMNKTYFIPKSKYDIEIEVEQKSDHAKVSYQVRLEGRYEIYLTSRGQNIVGSPFNVTASRNIIGILERDSFCLEDGEEIDIVDIKTDRKVILRIVDFVTEKMLLKENGTLEKISDDEAKILMSTANNELPEVCKSCKPTTIIKDDSIRSKTYTFNKAVNKIIKLNRVRKMFNELLEDKLFHTSLNAFMRPNQQYIPDVVNSTFNEGIINPFNVTEKVDKFIVPESISVSICTEKPKSHNDQFNEKSATSDDDIILSKSETIVPQLDSSSANTPDSLEKCTHFQSLEQDSIDRSTPLSANNPFLNDICGEDYLPQDDLPVHTSSEYDINNSKNEEILSSPIKIIIQKSDSISYKNNPFLDDNIIELERPKSPVFKIISGDVPNHEDSFYTETKNELISEDMLGNEFINPFFVHHHPTAHEQLPIADFIIGAPVSLPPMIRVPSPEPLTDPMRSLSITSEDIRIGRSNVFDMKNNNEVDENIYSEVSQTDYLLPKPLEVPQSCDKLIVSSTFHSLESSEILDDSNASSNGENDLYELSHLDSSDRSSPPRKDMWDSAYVSIDDNNTSADSNNNSENVTICETVNKQQLISKDNKYGLKQEEITNMGPAEREIWQSCYELNNKDIIEDSKPSKWELKRPTFTPIIEETDRNMPIGTKDSFHPEKATKHNETDTVTVAFAEINDMYQEYFPKSEVMSVITSDNAINECDLQNIKEGDKNEDDLKSVDSASEYLTDVKRHEYPLEGQISEVQANVTESVSVSPTLQSKSPEQTNECFNQSKDKKEISNKQTNIVLEKKKYWDEKIKQIEAKTKEANALLKKRPASKQLKHDSLTKRKGKQIVKTLLNSGSFSQNKQSEIIDTQTKSSSIKISEPVTRFTIIEQEKSDEKLVEKWKKYWDDKLENVVLNDTNPMRTNTTKSKVSVQLPKSGKLEEDVKTRVINSPSERREMSLDPSPLKVKQELLEQIKSRTKYENKTKSKDTKFKTHSIETMVKQRNQVSDSSVKKEPCGEDPRPSANLTTKHVEKTETKIDTGTDDNKDSNEPKDKPSPIPIKQEIPEEVYKAFETSPKRFFGTSRKHILNKIDTFLGKPNIEHKATIDVINTGYDNGLVSSRISLFHNLTNTEELPLEWARKKSQSLHNVRQRNDSDKSVTNDRKDSGRSSISSESGFVDFKKATEPNKPAHRAEIIALNRPLIVEERVSSEDISNRKPRVISRFKSFLDECSISESNETLTENNFSSYVKNQLSYVGQKPSYENKYKNNELLRRKSISKSEMDIFNKIPNESEDDYPDRYKSCDELPKINVKRFISLYESASRTSVDTKPVKRIYRTSSMDSHKHSQPISTATGAAKTLGVASHSIARPSSANSYSKSNWGYESPKRLTLFKRSDTLSSVDTEDSMDIKVVKYEDKETTYVSLSDIELEIIESSPEKSDELSPEETTVAEHIEYKNRFKSAKEYFQSLEELREVKKPKKLNECELLLHKQSTESLNDDRSQKRVNKRVKSRSLPSSEISKIWNQLQESQKEENSTRLVKISEKFNVDDLFSDVMEGRLSRQGSLRGIPHKKAVLEAFRSMENISDKNLSSYELTASQPTNFGKDSQGRNAQTYLSEYPYLPTTDPSKFHSRLDAKASGLISFKELLETKPRRNSVPDLRLNPKFTVDL